MPFFKDGKAYEHGGKYRKRYVVDACKERGKA